MSSWHYWTNKDDKVLKPNEIKNLLRFFLILRQFLVIVLNLSLDIKK